MYSLAQMIGQGYQFGAPSAEAEEIDTQVAEGLRCRKCGSSMRYEGYHKNSGGYAEYIALAVCNECGYEVSF
jgi:hypothetical protein